MNMRRMKVRRAAMIGTGVVLVTSLGLSGVSIASAAAPAGKIKQGATWTMEVTGGFCLYETFATTTHRFKSAATGANDKGTWSGGGSTITMTWTKGSNEGLLFKGAWTTVGATKGFEGPMTLNSAPYGDGLLVKGVIRCG
jgi:hypothetical protein